ncbi:hypothetical protein [Methylobacterium sp. WL8]|uniref:hypothetical protein n=1 Tax=Methylobacterium sp. WL8 TaxID=2603899 RepID=UPI0011CC71E6|nr:hypothetical protein [Methylobacterium sp. WL8]TXN81955.1 hypothetical protein FV234_11445 [Methylobacterium sp. WL8]
MTERYPVYSHLYKMEDEVADVGRWSEVIRDLGTGDGEVSQAGLFAIGGVMIELSKRLEARWRAAFDAAKAEALR